MVYGFDNYIFVDQNDKILEERELRDEEAAEKACESLVRTHNKVVGCYKQIVVIDPIDLQKGDVR
jgi:hypothetical protein